MVGWWGGAVVRLRWWVPAAGLLLVLTGATWGAGVFGALSGGGYDDPDSESNRATAGIAAQLGQRDPDLLVLWSSDTSTVSDPAFRAAVTRAVDAIRAQTDVAQVAAYTDREASPALVSNDRRATYAAVYLRAIDEDGRLAAYHRVEPALAAPGLTTRVGGVVAFTDQANTQTEQDITRAEIFSLPILFVLLVLIFRGLIAALSPLVIGGIAILGAFVAVRADRLRGAVPVGRVRRLRRAGAARGDLGPGRRRTAGRRLPRRRRGPDQGAGLRRTGRPAGRADRAASGRHRGHRHGRARRVRADHRDLPGHAAASRVARDRLPDP